MQPQHRHDRERLRKMKLYIELGTYQHVRLLGGRN
jgi:hypothetical protein